jgi:hypothetical protein
VAKCPHCSSAFHFSCLDYQTETIDFFNKNPKRWQCPRCIKCTKCQDYIHDEGNVQCYLCGKAYHGQCRPRRLQSPPSYPNTRWTCLSPSCQEISHTALNGVRNLSPNQTSENQNSSFSELSTNKLKLRPVPRKTLLSKNKGSTGRARRVIDNPPDDKTPKRTRQRRIVPQIKTTNSSIRPIKDEDDPL